MSSLLQRRGHPLLLRNTDSGLVATVLDPAQAGVYSTSTRLTVSLQNGIGASPALSVSTTNSSCERIMSRNQSCASQKAVGRREAEGHLRGRAAIVGVLAADGEAGSLAHAFKLWLMTGRCDGWMGPFVVTRDLHYVALLSHSWPRKPGNLATFLRVRRGPILASRKHCDLTVQPPPGVFRGDAR